MSLEKRKIVLFSYFWWKTRSDARSIKSVRAHKALFHGTRPALLKKRNWWDESKYWKNTFNSLTNMQELVENGGKNVKIMEKLLHIWSIIFTSKVAIEFFLHDTNMLLKLYAILCTSLFFNNSMYRNWFRFAHTATTQNKFAARHSSYKCCETTFDM